MAGKPFSPAEEEWLCVHIAARQVQDVDPETISADDDEALVNYILRYINSQYNYNLLDDAQLHADLLTHIKTMITRVRYQIMIPNPLLDNIKQHYPMAWDMTLAAVSSWGKYTPYTISENEIGFLVLHIGVGLERHYNIGYQRQPHVPLVCDTSNAMVRMIEAILQRKYPQLAIAATISSVNMSSGRRSMRILSSQRYGSAKRQTGGDHRAVPHRLPVRSDWQAGAGGSHPSVDVE